MLFRSAPKRSGGGPIDFSGEWELEKSENFDKYLESMGVSPLHRKYALGAKVSHKITQPSGGREVTVCVVNKLGTKCETLVTNGKAVASTDAQKAPITKRTKWEAGGKRLVTRVETPDGARADARTIAKAKMVMEITSPSGVVARRIFRCVGGACLPESEQ